MNLHQSFSFILDSNQSLFLNLDDEYIYSIYENLFLWITLNYVRVTKFYCLGVIIEH